MIAATVCVDFSFIFKYTLPYNRHHFSKYLVITTPTDTDTITLAERHDCIVHTTTAFYDDGALFNKWKALEEGLDVLGREGWMCMLDADIFWPRRINQSFLMGNLYTPQRRLARQPLPETDWSTLPLHPSKQFCGYSHIFHVDDPHVPAPPWYQTDWVHAGGADSFFQRLWEPKYKIRPNFEVLHVGNPGNWAGLGNNKKLTQLLSKRVYPNPDYSHERIRRNNTLQ